MRILHAIEHLDPKQGGPPAVAAHLAAAQAAAGHDVTLISHTADGIPTAFRGVRHIDLVNTLYCPQETGLDMLRLPRARVVLEQALSNADVLHLHGVWEPLLWTAALIARSHGVPYVVRPAGMLDPWSLSQKRLKKRLALALGFRRMLDRASFIHTLNRDERDLVALLGLSAPVEVIPNGVFIETFDDAPPPGTFRSRYPQLGDAPFVLFLSRLHYKKGLDYLADGFASIAARMPDLKLVVAGPDDGARADFEHRINRYKLENRVLLTGPLYQQHEKLSALRDATLFCLPSRQEGFSVAILEALAMGLPVVITQPCHFPEVQDASAGRVVPLAGRAVGDAILKVAQDASLRSRMAENARRLIRTGYVWPHIAQQCVAFYLKHGAANPQHALQIPPAGPDSPGQAPQPIPSPHSLPEPSGPHAHPTPAVHQLHDAPSPSTSAETPDLTTGAASPAQLQAAPPHSAQSGHTQPGHTPGHWPAHPAPHPASTQSPPLRILHVVRDLDPAAGGPPVVAVKLATAQAMLGHDVHMLTYQKPSAANDVQAMMGSIPHSADVEQHYLPEETRVESLLGSSAARVARNLVRRFDVVHLHGVWEPMLLRVAAECRRAGVAYVFTPHGMLDPWSLAQRKLKKQLAIAVGVRHALNGAMFLHMLNTDERDLVGPLKLTAPGEIIPNGVFEREVTDLPPRGTFRAAYPELGDDPYVLFLSRLHYKKGLDFLAEAFAAVSRQLPSLRLVVAGPDGGAKADFQSQIAAAGLQARTHLVGPIYGPMKIAAVVDAAAFCLPSRQEGFSMAITEALGCGCPCVVTHACHYPDVETSGAGYCTDLDGKSVGDALLKLLSAPESARQSAGENGRRLVLERYTWPVIAERACALYLRHAPHLTRRAPTGMNATPPKPTPLAG